jgi:prevent-host-death family protein
MVIYVSVSDAKAMFFTLVERVEEGEEVIIGEGGRAMAKLISFEEPTDEI